MALLIVAAVVLLVLAIAAATALRRADDAQRIAAGAAILVLAAMTIYVVLTAGAPGATGGPLGTHQSVQPTTSAGPTIEPSLGVAPAQTFLRYEVRVPPGQYTLYQVDAQGQIQSERVASFDTSSHAPVDRFSRADGSIYWQVVLGGLAGWSFIPEQSGGFSVFAVFAQQDGTLTYEPVSDEGS